jgi:hypothetical protein
MTSEEFIKRIQVAVYDSAIKGTLSLLEKPPGRCPSPCLVKLSQWFNQLSPEDREHIRGIIQMTAGDAVFGMLVVLDGDRSIREASEPLGLLELRYKVGEQSMLLNDPAGAPLHDLFVEQVPLP